jgi:hypothetical protein
MARTPSSEPPASRQHTDPAKIAEPDHVIRDAANGHAHAKPSGRSDGRHDSDTYAVGYGRPPVHSRFKPGQSGNTRGRQKQSRNMRTVLQQVLSEDMQIRESGRVRRMATFEALVRTTLNRAFKGDPKAMASLLVLVKHCGYGADHDAPAAELLSGTNFKAIIDDYIDRNVPEPQTLTGSATDTRQSPPTAASPQINVRRP